MIVYRCEHCGGTFSCEVPADRVQCRCGRVAKGNTQVVSGDRNRENDAFSSGTAVTRGRKVPFTQEEQERARVALAESRVSGREKYRHDFLDSGSWDELAATKGLRLPQWHLGPTPGNMEKWLRKLGVSVAQYCAWSGDKGLSDFAKLNPDWPLRAWIGLMLEQMDAGGLRL